MAVTYRFLFDECLTPDLVAAANGAGHAATHVNYLDRQGTADRVLAVIAVESDAVFVTNNGDDFRRIYRQFDLHPGLVVILPSVSTPRQIELFLTALDRLIAMPDCVNLLIEVDSNGEVSVSDWSKDWRSNA